MALLDTVTDLLFPEKCFGCGRIGHGMWCTECRDATWPIREVVCKICGFPEAPISHARCHPDRPGFDFARSASRYENPLKSALLRFKYGGYRRLASPLSEHLDPVLTWAAEMGGTHVVVVPSDPVRRWRRGFNPVELLAEESCGRVGLPILKGAVVRKAGGAAQAGLGRSQRMESSVGRFVTDKNEELKCGIPIILDDVYTTGSTVSELARVLKSAGAKRVLVVTLARD